MSVRQLHVLFEPGGTSFAQYLLSRRLEECKVALLNPIRRRSVTDIAFAWGFNSLATFHRALRQAFGVTPGELRAAGPNRGGLWGCIANSRDPAPRWRGEMLRPRQFIEIAMRRLVISTDEIRDEERFSYGAPRLARG
jgi:AraC-like DNA-binding protein